MRRYALLIGADTFKNGRLKRLRAPAKDLAELKRVLDDQSVGEFHVQTVHNKPAHKILEAIEDFFQDRERDDLLLVYYSGHGLKDISGGLYLAGTNTRPDRLASRAVPAQFLQQQIQRSCADRIVLLLDCCYSGAFANGLLPRAPADDLNADIGASGVAWMTATTAYEYAFEDNHVRALTPTRPSRFTKALIDGLDSGHADLDQDGLITFDELYEFVSRHMRQFAPEQQPTSSKLNAQGQLLIAKRRGAILAPPSREPVRTPEPVDFRLPRTRYTLLGLAKLGFLPAVLLPLRAAGWEIPVLPAFERWLLGFVIVTVWFSAVAAWWRATWSHTVIDRSGITAHLWRPVTVSWHEVDLIQIRANWLSKRVTVLCRNGAEITLPAPRSTLLLRDKRLTNDVDTITDWQAWALGTDPVPATRTTGGATWATLWAIALTISLVSALVVWKPWTLL